MHDTLMLALFACEDPPPPPAPPAPPAEPAGPPPLRIWEAPGSAEVYLTAGPDGCVGPTGQGFSGCAVHRVQIDLDENQIRRAEQVVQPVDSSAGSVRPTPAGDRIVYVEGGNAGAVVRVRATTDRDPTALGEVWSTGLLAPADPVWLADGTVLVHEADRAVGCAARDGACAPIAGWGDWWTLGAGAEPRRVAGVELTASIGFGAPAPLVGPGRRVLTAARTSSGAPPSCSGACAPVSEPKPLVHDLDGGAPRWLAATLDGKPIAVGAVAALNAETFVAVDAGAEPDRVVRLEEDRAVPLLALPKPATDMAPMGGADACSIVTFRTLDACVDAQHLVLTVTCTCTTDTCRGTHPEGRLVYARPYLVDISERAQPVWVDLLTPVERAAGSAPGSLFARDLACTRGLVAEGPAADRTRSPRDQPARGAGGTR